MVLSARISSAFLALFLMWGVCSASLCPKDWSRTNHGCYLLISEKQTWFEAVETCADKGGHIVEVDSEEEWGALGTLSLLMGGMKDFWLNLRSGERFVWESSDSEMDDWQVEMWAEGQPDKLCAVARKGDNGVFKWFSESCGLKEEEEEELTRSKGCASDAARRRNKRRRRKRPAKRSAEHGKNNCNKVLCESPFLYL